jgi:hypothetical protein
MTRATELQVEELTEEHLQYAAVLAHRLRQMADQTSAAAKKAEEVVRQLERLMAERKKTPLTIDATATVKDEQVASSTAPASSPRKRGKEHGAERVAAAK